jgi:hypothetical protein
MTIDLSRFSKNTEAILPIIDNLGKVGGRRVAKKIEDGWYKVSLGNKITIQKKATPLEVFKALRRHKKLLVYSVGSEGVPFNFENFKNRGFNESVQVHFLNSGLLELVQIVQWEDGRFYFYDREARRERQLIQRIKEAFDSREELPDVPGISPEIRYAFLLGQIARGSYEAAVKLSNDWTLSDKERSVRSNNLTLSFEYTLKESVRKAGGTLIGFTDNGNHKLIEWEVGGQRVKSKVNSDLRIISAGFCLSGEDKKHSLNSIINLAKLFQQRSPLYITRE